VRNAHTIERPGGNLHEHIQKRGEDIEHCKRAMESNVLPFLAELKQHLGDGQFTFAPQIDIRITSRTSRIATVDVGGGRILLFGLDDIRQPPRNSKTEGNRGRSLQLFWATQQSGAFIRCHLRHFNRLCSRTKISRA
jgi:hypothetical protein